VTSDLLVVSWNRIARRDGAQSEFAFADLEGLGVSGDDENCGKSKGNYGWQKNRDLSVHR
jgi:hypothetical protein